MDNPTKLKIIGFLKGLYFYSAIMTLFFLNKGISLEDILLSTVIYAVFSFLGEVPTGIFADIFGQKASVAAGYFIETIGVFMMLLAPNSFTLYIALALRGLAGSFVSGSEEALFYESISDKTSYQKEFGVFMSNTTLGMIIAPLVSGLLVQSFGEASYAMVFVFTALAQIIATILALSIKTVRTDAELQKKSKLTNIVQNTISLFKQDKAIVVLTIAGVLTLSGEYSLRFVYQPYLAAHNISVSVLGFALSAGFILNYFLTKNAYRLEKYFPLEMILVITNGAIGLAYILLAFVATPLALLGIFVLIQGFFNTKEPILSDFINSRVEHHFRSTALSAISFILTIAMVLQRIIFTFLVAHIGISYTLLTQGIYMVIGVGISYWLLVRCDCSYKVKHTV